VAAQLPFRLVAPTGVVFEGEIAEIQLPTPAGPITLLPEHMPLVSAVATGVLSVRPKPGDDWTEADHYAIEDGILTVTPDDGAVLVVESAEHADTIDALEAERAAAEARAALENQIEADQIVVTQRVVQRNMARLSATKLRRRHRHHAPRIP
jgi:F-type H+-transporting ATPase subunit epsilon